MKMLIDINAIMKSTVVNLAIAAIWYYTEYKQFGTLQLDRTCDNIIGCIYMFVLWWAFHKINCLKSEIELKKSFKNKTNNIKGECDNE